jgi:hypothetical protein
MTTTLHITLLTLAGLLLSGCGTTGHVAALHDFGGDADTLGQNPVCTFEVQKSLNDRVSAKYLHQSWCSSGWPANDNPESTIDAFGVELQIW